MYSTEITMIANMALWTYGDRKEKCPYRKILLFFIKVRALFLLIDLTKNQKNHSVLRRILNKLAIVVFLKNQERKNNNIEKKFTNCKWTFDCKFTATKISAKCYNAVCISTAFKWYILCKLTHASLLFLSRLVRRKFIIWYRLPSRRKCFVIQNMRSL